MIISQHTKKFHPSLSIEKQHESIISDEMNEKSSEVSSNTHEIQTNFYYIDPSYNHKGNYNNYILQALYSILNMQKTNENIQERLSSLIKIILPELTYKKTIVLDIDETLIHADCDYNFKDHDAIIRFISNDINKEIIVPLIFRPGLFQFLENLSYNFEIISFTASKKEYADAVLNCIDPEGKIFKCRLYREHCIKGNDGKIFIKDLSIFANRKIENIVIVDNSLYSFANQLSNGILVNSFYGDKTDLELYNLYHYLEQFILRSSDTRIINEQVFRFSQTYQSLLSNNITSITNEQYVSSCL
jgi:CTD small phosphatase-like protein 2